MARVEQVMMMVADEKIPSQNSSKVSIPSTISSEDSTSQFEYFFRRNSCDGFSNQRISKRRSIILSDNSYGGLPKKKVEPFDNSKPIAHISGPGDSEEVSSYGDVLAGICSSTYPLLGNERSGDPICDKYEAIMFDKHAILAIADGCSWGNRVKQAADRAVSGFLQYMLDHQTEIRDVQDAGHFLLRAFDCASREITKDVEHIWDAGTTTLLGGVLLPLVLEENEDTQKWCFVCVSVGDCKAFLWSAERGKLIDITQGNRCNINNASDPGGRLGPTLEGGYPDLRNLKVYYSECFPGDSIILMSDGIHDNFDPKMLGKKPQDFSIDATNWDEASQKYPSETFRVQTKFMKKSMRKILKNEKSSPKQIVKQFFSHCWKLTKSSRLFMETETKPLPRDFEKYPGKMDHSTCVYLKVGMVLDGN